MYFCKSKRKLNSKNLPTKPIRGGIPDIDKKIRTTLNDIKLNLFKIFRLFKFLIFFKSYKNNKVKNM